jgi:hypothetical protein
MFLLLRLRQARNETVLHRGQLAELGKENTLKKSSISIFYSCAITIAIVSFCRTSIACQVDECFLTKAGFLASPSPEHLQEANGYEKTGSKEKLDDLINSKIILLLKDNIKVQALEWSIERKMIKIKFDGSNDTYWVNDGALKHIKAGDKSEK